MLSRLEDEEAADVAAEAASEALLEIADAEAMEAVMEEEAKEPYSDEKAEALRARLLSLAQPTTTTNNNSRPAVEEPAVEEWRRDEWRRGWKEQQWRRYRGRADVAGDVDASRRGEIACGGGGKARRERDRDSRRASAASGFINECDAAAGGGRARAADECRLSRVDHGEPAGRCGGGCSSCVVEQEAAAEDEDPASLHDDQMVDISDTTIVSNQAAPPPPLPPRLELPKLKPGETVWIPSRKCVATVQANNPVLQGDALHVRGRLLARAAIRRAAQAASNGNAAEHSHALSSAMA